MRNTAISIISVILIAIYSLFSMVYTDKFTNELKRRINYAEANGYTAAVADSLADIIEDNMPVLVFTASKDHIETLEECIINICYAVEYNDMQTVMVYKTLLVKTAEEMSTLNKSPI